MRCSRRLEQAVTCASVAQADLSCRQGRARLPTTPTGVNIGRGARYVAGMQQAALCIHPEDSGRPGAHADGGGGRDAMPPESSSSTSPSSSSSAGDADVKPRRRGTGAGGQQQQKQKQQARSGTRSSIHRRTSLSLHRLAQARSVRTQTYNYVLGVSSLWLLWPSGHGCYRAIIGEDRSPLALLLTAAATVTAS